MARSSRQRALPRTPRVIGDEPGGAGQDGRPVGPDAAAPADPRERYEVEPAYLVKGTQCLAGHERGHEFVAGRIGELPTRRTTRIGLALLAWCTFGVAFLVDRKWLSFGLQVLVLWLAFSAVVQRRMGHRGRCWRTRAWRQAWGGLVPRTSDPTRPVGD